MEKSQYKQFDTRPRREYIQSWTGSTIADFAKRHGMAYMEAVYEAKKRKLPFSEEKIKELEAHKAEARANRFNHYVEPSTRHDKVRWQNDLSGGIKERHVVRKNGTLITLIT